MINLQNISKNYNNKIIFQNINLEIKKNSAIAIVGKSGSGKTTFLNILACLESPTSGEIKYEDKNILNNIKLINKFYRNTLGILIQNYGLIESDSISENIEYYLTKEKYKKLDNNEISTVLQKLGVDKSLDTKIYELSGGEAQRVALARVILKEPELIIADEPTGNLDQINAEMIIDEILKMKNHKTSIIVVTHDLNIAKKFDKVYELKNMNLLEIEK